MSKKAKQAMRLDMGRILSNLDQRWARVASGEICAQISQLIDNDIGQEVEHVLAWSGSGPGEPNLSQFVAQQLKERSVYFPTFYDEGKLLFHKLDAHLFDTTKSFEGSLVREVEFDTYDVGQSALIIPGLAFDLAGNRLGWGELHYERFLSNSRLKSVVKIGIAWSMQMVKEVPCESTDLIMDWVVTERSAYQTAPQFNNA